MKTFNQKNVYYICWSDEGMFRMEPVERMEHMENWCLIKEVVLYYRGVMSVWNFLNG